MNQKNTLPIRAVVIDDSPTLRELLVGILHESGDINVVGVGANGEDAVRLARRMKPDVITMDIRMPKMDGLTATQRIMHENPIPIVIVSGSMKQQDMEMTFQALRAGALAVVHKPGLDDPETCQQIVKTVRMMAGVPVVHHWSWAADKRARQKAPEPAPAAAAAIMPDIASLHKKKISIIGIAASTGGPSVIASILGLLPADFPLPIILVQHITSGFANGLAEWLSTQTLLRVDIAAHGEALQAGTVFLAPDDYHIQVNKRGIVELSKAPPYKGLRPSANHMFHSLAQSYSCQALGIILTGMGDDGADGLAALRSAGGLSLSQDEESCIVYGMPREAAARGAVVATLKPVKIAELLLQLGLAAKEGVA